MRKASARGAHRAVHCKVSLRTRASALRDNPTLFRACGREMPQGRTLNSMKLAELTVTGFADIVSSDAPVLEQYGTDPESKMHFGKW